MAKGRIAILSLLTAANVFIRCGLWATWFLGVSLPNSISISSVVFCIAHPCAYTTTDTQTTLRVTSVAVGRIYALRVDDAA